MRQTQKFGSIESGLIEKNGGLIFKEGIARKNYFHRREPKERDGCALCGSLLS